MKAKASQIESAIVPHLDAAFNLARWLMREDSAARDAVQSASVRAITYFASLRGTDAKNWFLGIVRNVCYSALKERSEGPLSLPFEDFADEPLHDFAGQIEASPGPMQELERRADRACVNEALRRIPAPFREVLILREMEELAYADIASIIDAPLGTVMSRLARARSLFRARYAEVEAGDKP